MVIFVQIIVEIHPDFLVFDPEQAALLQKRMVFYKKGGKGTVMGHFHIRQVGMKQYIKWLLKRL